MKVLKDRNKTIVNKEDVNNKTNVDDDDVREKIKNLIKKKNNSSFNCLSFVN